MSKKEMILALIDHFSNGNKAQFANKIGVTPQTISTWISRNTFDMERIFALCEGVSAEWLFTGNGPMLKKDIQSQTDYSNLDNIGLIKGLIDKVGELSVQLGEQTKENEHLYQKNMELQSKINELKEGMGDRWNKSPRRDPVYSHPDIAAEPGPEE